MEYTIKECDLLHYEAFLQEEEKSAATMQCYLHDLRRFFHACEQGRFTKETVGRYKASLLERYAPASVNRALAALNGFFSYMGWHSCRVRPVRVQRSTYLDPRRELSREEYLRLVEAAKAQKKERLALLLQTICSTGIRVSELRFVTAAALGKGRMTVNNKGKCRTVLLPRALCTKLQAYCRRHGVHSGSVFVTRSGQPLDRSNIWCMMKSLCRRARVDRQKVFPHNLRHLFARCFYQKQKDIDHLASVLGHSSINTTRIYTQTSGEEHRRQLEQLRLLI